MMIAHYLHRLPANYDLGLIRERVKARAGEWDDEPELFFKAFMLREAGQFGAIANSYSSLYLWRQDDPIRNFLVSGRYKVVTDTFGRADIKTRFVLDARKGGGAEARFAYKEELDIPVDADLATHLTDEIERNKTIVSRPGVVASAVGVDPLNWKVTRIALSADDPRDIGPGVVFQVLYLAHPLLETLPA
jgi:Domain of unknown function (DUF4865)